MSNCLLSWSMRALRVAACCSLFCCTHDGDDGKASIFTVVSLDVDGGLAIDAALPALAGDAGTPVLSLNCRKAVVSEHTLGGFSVSVRDQNGPLANVFVAISPSTGTVVSREAGGDHTDARGSVEFSYAAPHFDAPTMISLDASVRDDQGKIVATARCGFKLATAGLAFSMPEANAVVPFGQVQTATLSVVAQDLGPSCASGGGVQLSTIGGGHANFAASSTDTPAAMLCLDVPLGGGDVPFWIHGVDAGGTARIQARSGDYHAELTLQMIGAPVSIALKADSSDLSPKSAANLTIKVQDDVGQGVAGITVEMSIARCADGSCADAESIAPSKVVTNAEGSASSAYFAGTSAGAAQINAVIADRPNVTSSTVLRVH